jgi:type VI secretion system secreted protein VgrG
VVTLRDFDFERPNADLTARRSSPKDHEKAECEVYDYPGDFFRRRIGEDRARIGLEQHQASAMCSSMAVLAPTPEAAASALEHSAVFENAAFNTTVEPYVRRLFSP